MALTKAETGEAPLGSGASATVNANGPADAAGAAAGAAPAAARATPSQPGALAVKPRAFKAVVGRGHPEFSSNRQQVRLLNAHLNATTRLRDLQGALQGRFTRV